jgi:uncharacterized membrane protein
MKEESLLLQALGDTTELRIIDFLIINTPTAIFKNEIIKRTGISRASFYKAWKKLEKFGIIKPVKKIGKIVLYDLDKENKLVKWLLKLDLSLMEQSIQKIEIPKKIAVRA